MLLRLRLELLRSWSVAARHLKERRWLLRVLVLFWLASGCLALAMPGTLAMLPMLRDVPSIRQKLRLGNLAHTPRPLALRARSSTGRREHGVRTFASS